MDIQRVSFSGKNKILAQLAKTTKTPREFKRNDLEQALILLGYQLDRINGSHRIFRNQHGDILSIAAAGNVVDPKSVKQVQTVLKNAKK